VTDRPNINTRVELIGACVLIVLFIAIALFA
jgi:hypothetical protein